MKAVKKPKTNRSRASSKFDIVRKIALALPGVEEGTGWGCPSFKVKGKLMACEAVHSSSEPDSLIVFNLEFEERDALIAENPDTFYFTDHYVKHPVVLVRLKKVRREMLQSLLETAWRRAGAKPRRSGPTD